MTVSPPPSHLLTQKLSLHWYWLHGN